MRASKGCAAIMPTRPPALTETRPFKVTGRPWGPNASVRLVPSRATTRRDRDAPGS